MIVLEEGFALRETGRKEVSHAASFNSGISVRAYRGHDHVFGVFVMQPLADPSHPTCVRIGDGTCFLRPDNQRTHHAESST